MADQQTASQGSGFRRHRHLAYKGRTIPWIAAILWIGWVVFAVVYFVRWVVPALP